MLFNSLDFALFLTLVFILYWLAAKNSLTKQNNLLLLASYFFYGYWDWRFLFLLIAISLSNYFIGILIENNQNGFKRKSWFILGLTINIGVLVAFKYFNFFVDEFIQLVYRIGYDLPKSNTKIILPLGISFYTFLSLSYIIDIYKKSLRANRNLIQTLLSFSFFPIILSGPIQRPATLIPQISRERKFSNTKAVDGLKQILWGLFTKVVIADNLASFVDDAFVNYSNYSGSTLLLISVFYSIQIYADFSGYSNIAIGSSKLLGFDIKQNFAYPYFANDISQFWKRWHITLTTWFRDYIFLPISYSMAWRINKEKTLLIRTDIFIYFVALIVTWLLTGLWHGANYTFIVWGLIHGISLFFYKLQVKPRNSVLAP